MKQNFSRDISIKLHPDEEAQRAWMPNLHRTMLLSCASLIAIVGVHQAARAQQAGTPIPDVSVNAAQIPPLMDGSAAAGYRVQDSNTTGPIWNELPVQDTPASIAVIPAPLIANTQSYTTTDLVKLIPQITNTNGQINTTGNPFYYVRGYALTQFTNGAGATYDGLLGGVGGVTTFTQLEDKESVSLLSGESAFLYGTGSVAGNLDYQLKRPTSTYLFDVTGGDIANKAGYVHLDLGGPVNLPGLADGLLGFRLNIVDQGGDTAYKNENIQRQLISAAIDIHLPGDVLLQLNAAHSSYKINGIYGSANPSYTTNTLPNGQPYLPYPPAPNPATLGSPSWDEYSTRTENGGAKVTWKINDIFTLRTQYDFTRSTRQDQDLCRGSLLTPGSGVFTETCLSSSPAQQSYINSGYSFLDASFNTFGAQHKITTGFTGYASTGQYDTVNYNFRGTYTNNLYDINTNLAQPAIYYTLGNPLRPGGFIASKGYAKNFVLGDEVKITDQWILFAGGNYTNLGNESFVPLGSPTTGYSKGAMTPTASLVYKPLPWLSAYFTYAQALTPGSQITNSATMQFTNAGDYLPPAQSTTYEAGLKATVGTNLLLTLAFFDLKTLNTWNQYNPATGLYTAEFGGDNLHKGVEFTATGKITPDLTLVGGFTGVDARVENNLTASYQNGQISTGVSPLSGKLYAEYTIPFYESLSFLKGLTLIGGFQANSWFYGNISYTAPNTYITATKFPGFVVGDLGFRYTTAVYEHPLTIRFNVDNFTNRAYWASQGYVGDPRTYKATAELKW